MQSLRGLKVGIAHIFKVDADKLRLADAGFRELLPDQLQHDRLSAAADTADDLDKRCPDKRPDAAHIQFSFYHKTSLPFRG